MATTFAALEARVTGLESRADRAEEDIASLITTVVEVRDDVRQLKRKVKRLDEKVGQLGQDVGQLKQDMHWTKRGVRALLDAQGLSVAADADAEESGV